MLRLALSSNCFKLLKYYWMIILVKSTTTVRDGVYRKNVRYHIKSDFLYFKFKMIILIFCTF